MCDGSSRSTVKFQFNEYGSVAFGSSVLMDSGSKLLKSGEVPAAGGLNGNLLAICMFAGHAPPREQEMSIQGFGNPECRLRPGADASAIPDVERPSGGVPRSCNDSSSSERLKYTPNPPWIEVLPGPPVN